MFRLKVDAGFCIGCYACEVACKQEHMLPVGPRLIRVISNKEKKSPQDKKPHFKPICCRHCGKAPCIEACSSDAIYKGEMGIVAVNAKKCTGCGDCLQACPFAVPQFHPVSGVAILCDLCKDRLQQGLKPACVHHCPAQALEIIELRRE